MVERGLVTGEKVFVSAKYVTGIITTLDVEVLVALIEEVLTDTREALRV